MFVENFNNQYLLPDLYLSNNNFFFLTLHIKLSTIFYLNQLTDIFAYEISSSKNEKNIINLNKYSKYSKDQPVIISYNFHSLLTTDRYFLFTSGNLNKKKARISSFKNSIVSITDLFPSAN
jgi:hypothetical protein